MTTEPRPPSFWSSLPGVLTGVAALVTAGTGLYLALRNDVPPRPQPTPVPEERELDPGQSPRAKFTGPMGPLEPGISYNGGDLYDSPANSAEDCVRICLNDDRCRAVTFILSQKRCWVKHRINPPASSPDMTSSRKLSS